MWELFFWTLRMLQQSTSSQTNNEKIARNLVSLAHSLLSVGLLYFEANQNIIIVCSGSYFIWDTLHMIEYNRPEWVYIYHHVVSVLFLLSKNIQMVREIFMDAELSNIPTYIVYHKLHTNKDSAPAKQFQLGWFFYFRIVIFSQYVYRYYENTFLMNNLLAIYLLGLYWFVKRLSALVASKKKLNPA